MALAPEVLLVASLAYSYLSSHPSHVKDEEQTPLEIASLLLDTGAVAQRAIMRNHWFGNSLQLPLTEPCLNFLQVNIVMFDTRKCRISL